MALGGSTDTRTLTRLGAVDVLDRDVFIIGKVGRIVLKGLEIDLGRFNIYFSHLTADGVAQQTKNSTKNDEKPSLGKINGINELFKQINHFKIS